MAISPTLLANGGSNVRQTSYNTSSISPSSNKLVLAFVANAEESGTPNEPTLSGNGLTWTKVATQVASSRSRLTLYRATGSSPSSGVITVNCTDEQQYFRYAIVEVSGTDIGGTNASNAIVQSTTGNPSDGSNNSSLTLSAISSTQNAVFGALCITPSAGGCSVTPGTGFTELQEDGLGNNDYILQTEWQLGTDNTVDWTYSTNATRVSNMAVEIKAQVLSGVFFSLL